MTLFLAVSASSLVLIHPVIVCRETGISLYRDSIGYTLKSPPSKVLGTLIQVQVQVYLLHYVYRNFKHKTVQP